MGKESRAGQDSSAAKPVSRLITELSRLPGIGPKSAQRIAYSLLRATEEQIHELADAVQSLKERTMLCSVCFNVTDIDPCLICRNEQRDHSHICVVEQPQDIMVLERTGIYKGVYHVLHGAVSPAEGVGTSDIRIRELVNRIQSGKVEEIILATNPTTEGEQTALYLSRELTPLGVRVTRIARGLPFGSELEYADDVTIAQALEGRRQL